MQLSRYVVFAYADTAIEATRLANHLRLVGAANTLTPDDLHRIRGLEYILVIMWECQYVSPEINDVILSRKGVFAYSPCNHAAH